MIRPLVRAGIVLVALFTGINPGVDASIRANGVPVRVILSYLEGISNWGPTDGTGIVEIAKSEGEVNGTVMGLPTLQGEVYHGWLVKTKEGEALPIGTFNTDTQGTAKLRYRLPTEIPDTGWNLFLLTVEAAGRTPTTPDTRRSLAGYFPGAPEIRELPQQLPYTGGDRSAVVNTVGPLHVVQTEPTSSPRSTTLLAVGVPALVVGILAWRVLPALRRRT